MTALYRAFDVVVTAVHRLSPSFVRIVFGGDDLAGFAEEGLDQRVKLLLPNARGGYPEADLSSAGWYAAWCALSAEERPPMRTYTVRRRWTTDDRVFLDVDFVLHGAGGPASRWAGSVAVGDRVKIIGPDAPAGGPWGSVAWNPPEGARRYLLAGDETAAPAIAAVLESLPPGTTTRAFIEVPAADDILPIATAEGTRVTWLPRAGHTLHGALLAAAIRAAIPAAALADAADSTETGEGTIWEVPGLDPATGARLPTTASTGTYVWLAGESGLIRELRRHLVGTAGIDRGSVAFMGYWRLGAAES
ncbi:MAG TPA: siderophore-interacting protein [Lacisediminihabitans sp.]|uniref:siderophore-interacting protein n=1 Tax=Lacisediminihabitans sp. TaxID=2787631 RepID=UPI002ED9D944